MMRTLALLTDFGYQDPYVGIMKGVVERIAPSCSLIDITHGIEMGNIHSGAYALWAAAPYFPEQTVFLAVVDPGVGSSRKALCFETEQGFCIAPDNGLASYYLKHFKPRAVYAIENERYSLQPQSTTFHGRDIFAPAAGHLLAGLSPSELGPVCSEWETLQWPEPEQHASGVRGTVISRDHFGNLISNLSLANLPQTDFSIQVGTRRIAGLSRSYKEMAAGSPLALIGSTGLLELSVNMGSAAELLEADVGTQVQILL